MAHGPALTLQDGRHTQETRLEAQGPSILEYLSSKAEPTPKDSMETHTKTETEANRKLNCRTLAEG